MAQIQFLQSMWQQGNSPVMILLSQLAWPQGTFRIYSDEIGHQVIDTKLFLIPISSIFRTLYKPSGLIETCL